MTSLSWLHSLHWLIVLAIWSSLGCIGYRDSLSGLHSIHILIVLAAKPARTHCLGCTVYRLIVLATQPAQTHCLLTLPVFVFLCLEGFVVVKLLMTVFTDALSWQYSQITYDSVYRRFVLAIQPTRSHVFVTQTLCFGCTDYTDSLSLRYSQHRLMPSLHSLRRLTGLAIQSQTHVLASIQHRLMSWLRSHLTIHCTSSAVLTLHQPSTTVMF